MGKPPVNIIVRSRARDTVIARVFRRFDLTECTGLFAPHVLQTLEQSVHVDNSWKLLIIYLNITTLAVL